MLDEASRTVESANDANEVVPSGPQSFTDSTENHEHVSGQKLEKGIMSWHVSLISLGGIIGSCYFLGLGLTLSQMGPLSVLIAYFLAGLSVFGVMQSFAELLVNLPRHGSFVSYNREFLGDVAAAGIGWAFWVNWIVYVPSECLAFATYMNSFYTIPFKNNAWSDFVWGAVCLVLLTAINLYHVKWFGHIESVMAILKILAIALFVVVAVLIWFGVIGKEEHPFTDEGGFIGAKIIKEAEGPLIRKLFPKGGFVIISYMIFALVNFQGSEIVGLSAAETQDPQKNVPAACKKVAYRIIMIYLIPILCLIFVVPYDKAGLEESVFSYVLTSYGMKWAAKLFTAITLVAAFSCANSGLYGTVRCLYGLSVEGLAPKFLSNLNKFGAPQNATIFTLIFIWVVFIIGFLSESLKIFGSGGFPLYANLLGISGFTGTLAWVGIVLSQMIFRWKLGLRGYSKESLSVKSLLYPGLQIYSIVLQVGSMIMLCFSDGGLAVFAISAVIIVVATLAFYILKKCGKIRDDIEYQDDEILFNEKYPSKALLQTTGLGINFTDPSNSTSTSDSPTEKAQTTV